MSFVGALCAVRALVDGGANGEDCGCPKCRDESFCARGVEGSVGSGGDGCGAESTSRLKDS